MVSPAWGTAQRRPQPSRVLLPPRERLAEVNRRLAEEAALTLPGEAYPRRSQLEAATPRMSGLPSACAPTASRIFRARARTGPSTSARAAEPFPAHPSSRLP